MDPRSPRIDAIEDRPDDVRRRHPGPHVHEVHPHEIAGSDGYGRVIEPPIEHRKQLIVLRGLGGIRARNVSLAVARAVDRAFDDDDLMTGERVFTARPTVDQIEGRVTTDGRRVG